MRRLLLNACAAAVLILGGWGGALASAVCPHASGAARAAEHACCRARAKSQTRRAGKSQTARQTAEQSTAHHSPRRAAQGGGDCHAQLPGARAAKHQDAGPRPNVRETAGPREVARAGAVQRGGVARPGASCAHCVSRPELPPASAKLRGDGGARRAADAPAERAPSLPATAGLSRAPAVAAARGAPPLTARRHVLLNLFLI